MKVEVEIYDDQIDLLRRIRALPAMIEQQIGTLPQSFPGGFNEVSRIKEICETLEFKWKKWIMDGFITHRDLSDLLKDIKIAKASEYIYDEDRL